jgi:holin-like protein
MAKEPQGRPPIVVIGIAILLACQLVGEVAVRFLDVSTGGMAFPGPVAGMGLMLIVLFLDRGRILRHVEPVAGGLLKNLSLLFVPAAVGITQYGDRLAEFGLALSVALVFSTLLTLLVTVGVFLLVRRMLGDGGANDG